MQDKTTRLETTSAGTGLMMKINTTANTPITIGGEPIKEVEYYVYLGSVGDKQGAQRRHTKDWHKNYNYI
jgi:hypothetical protein